MSWLESLRAWLVARWRALAIGGGVMVIGVIAFHVLRRRAGFWTIDDSAITYSAAFELTDHHSVAPYVEGPPIESYSNPLLFFVTALLRWIAPYDPIATHIYVEAIVFGTMLLLVWLILRMLANDAIAVIGALAFGAVELATPASWIWYGSGLENVWVSAGLVALVWLCVRTARGRPLGPGWGAIGAAVALLRPEAPVYVAAFYVALVTLAKPADQPWRAHLRRVALMAAVTATLFIAFLVWRRLAYHAWVPNTYYAKVPGHGGLKDHFVHEVLGGVLGYHRAAMFAASAIALMMFEATERVGQILFVMLLAALVMPLVGGADWMGELRFGTPFLAVAHLAWAALLAVCLMRARRASAMFTAVAVACVGLLLRWDGVPAQPPQLSTVTTGLVAELWGARRWEAQMRLGLPYPVVLDPDVGGALFVGGMQLVDNAMLADYQTARMRHDDNRQPVDAGLVTQYELAERTPDLVNDNPAWPVNMAVVQKDYRRGADGIWTRKDLVEVPVPADAPLLLSDSSVRVYLSPDTVTTAAPGALVRIEVFVTWSQVPDRSATLVAKLLGDRDELTLAPYQPDEHGSERRAFLLGAPAKRGSYEVQLSLVRAGLPAFPAIAIPIDVVDSVEAERRATVLARSGAPLDGARRVAWLREQRVPRVSLADYREWFNELRTDDQKRSKMLGAVLRALRDNAELADLRGVTDGISAAEGIAIDRVLTTCPAGADSQRALCLGHRIDSLRRLGYIGVLDRVPLIAKELTELHHRSVTWPTYERYRALVGIVLAAPWNLDAQRDLLHVRAQITDNNFPPL